MNMNSYQMKLKCKIWNIPKAQDKNPSGFSFLNIFHLTKPNCKCTQTDQFE